jgi:hypothetical protein
VTSLYPLWSWPTGADQPRYVPRQRIIDGREECHGANTRSANVTEENHLRIRRESSNVYCLYRVRRGYAASTSAYAPPKRQLASSAWFRQRRSRRSVCHQAATHHYVPCETRGEQAVVRLLARSVAGVLMSFVVLLTASVQPRGQARRRAAPRAPRAAARSPQAW